MTDARPPLFRIVDGERVRIPGDERVPGRRYGNVDGVLVEFTNEEERQRDEDERIWAEQALQREAEAERQRAEAAKFRESLRYGERVVAFLDVLGWREAISRSRTNADFAQELGVTLAGLRSHVRQAEWMAEHSFRDDLQISQFSDSIVISVLAENVWDAQNTILMPLGSIVDQLLEAGLLVRGGICKGLMIHQGGIAYGPALTAAYDLEQAAEFPRVLLDDELIGLWSGA